MTVSRMPSTVSDASQIPVLDSAVIVREPGIHLLSDLIERR